MIYIDRDLLLNRMNNKEHIIKKENIKPNKSVHFVLLNSYLIFLIAVILGAFLDPILNKRLFSHTSYQITGFILLFISSVLIYWAQKASLNYKEKKHKDESRSFFESGPYRYLRSPTHLGLFIMAIGFSLIINSFFGVMLSIIAHLITKLFFIKKQEDILEAKYGQIYRDYKKKVKNFI